MEAAIVAAVGLVGEEWERTRCCAARFLARARTSTVVECEFVQMNGFSDKACGDTKSVRGWPTGFGDREFASSK